MLLAVIGIVVAAMWLTGSDPEPTIKHRPIDCPPREPLKSMPGEGPLRRFDALEDLARNAFDAGHLYEADVLAAELVEHAPHYAQDWNHGNALHHGNLVRGRVALARGDVAEAKRRLLAAGSTPGSPQLDSFGPNMALAHELLERGERDVVLQYLQLCKRFWESHDGTLDAWAADVVAGRFPDFRANNCY
jgi:hypothetical protein